MYHSHLHYSAGGTFPSICNAHRPQDVKEKYVIPLRTVNHFLVEISAEKVPSNRIAIRLIQLNNIKPTYSVPSQSLNGDR
jgi:hypothetical protein